MTQSNEVIVDAPKALIFKNLILAIDNKDFKNARDMAIVLENRLDTEIERELFSKVIAKLPKQSSEPESSESPLWNKLSECEKTMTIHDGISIVSCCMNRNDNLVKALRSWVKLPVDEIIIVDWSSTVPVEESISQINDKRVKVIRVEDEPKWVLTYGFNVGLRLAQYKRIYKLDADIVVQPDFLIKNYFSKGEYVRGDWKLALENETEDQVFVNGSFGAFKSDLAEIGYYNEFITTYGWDDSDLYQRLSYSQRLRAVALKPESLVHVEQNADDRIKYQEVVNSNVLGVVSPTDFSNLRNQILVGIKNYWNKNSLQDYVKTSSSKTLKRIKAQDTVASSLVIDSEIYAIQRLMFQYARDLLHMSDNYAVLSEFLLFEYKNHIPYDATKTLLRSIFNKDGNYILKLGPIDYSPGSKERVLSKKSFRLLTELFSERTAYLEEVVRPAVEINANKFFVDAQHGLGNRLRAIGSAAAIAKATGKELVIVWEPDHHCECRFSDLFDYEGEVIEKSFLEQAKKDGDVFNYMEIENGAEKDKPIVVKPTKYVYARAAYTFVHEASHWEAENEFIKALKPSKQVLDLIAPFNVDGHIAAHIRMEAGAGLDHNTYDSVENWTQEGHDQLHFWREKSHYSAFLKRIDKLIEEDSSLKLFVATDLQDTYDIFEQYYGDRLVYLKRNVFDRSKEQIIYALADVLLLSKCKKLLGSTWSSFSEAAMRLSNTYSEIEMSGRDF